MRDSLRKICDDFITNRDSIKSAFRWEISYILPLCAAEFAAKGLSADTEKMKECKAILKTGRVFSPRSEVISLCPL